MTFRLTLSKEVPPSNSQFEALVLESFVNFQDIKYLHQIIQNKYLPYKHRNTETTQTPDLLFQVYLSSDTIAAVANPDMRVAHVRVMIYILKLSAGTI